MGRKLVEAGAVADNILTTNRIDQLKELFNVLGAQVTSFFSEFYRSANQ